MRSSIPDRAAPGKRHRGAGPGRARRGERRGGRRGAERARGARGVRHGARVEHVGTPLRLRGRRRGAGRGRRAGRLVRRHGGSGRARAAAAALLEPEFHVLLELPHLLLQRPVLELKLLDLARELAHLVLEAIEAHDRVRGILGERREAEGEEDQTGGNANHGRHPEGRSDRAVITKAPRGRRGAGIAPLPEGGPQGGRGREPGPVSGQCVSLRRPPRAAPPSGKRTQAPAPPSRTVTARRFWDQQEMSLQTATGRSFP